MFIRNKGTPAAPKFFVVENYRVTGEKHPRQRTIFNLRKNPSVESAIRHYTEMAKIAREDPDSIILKTNPGIGSLSRIKYCIKKLKDLQHKMETNARVKRINNEISGIKTPRHRLGKSMKLKLKLLELQKMICKCHPEDISKWDADVRRNLKKMLNEASDFKQEL